MQKSIAAIENAGHREAATSALNLLNCKNINNALFRGYIKYLYDSAQKAATNFRKVKNKAYDARKLFKGRKNTIDFIAWCL